MICVRLVSACIWPDSSMGTYRTGHPTMERWCGLTMLMQAHFRLHHRIGCSQAGDRCRVERTGQILQGRPATNIQGNVRQTEGRRTRAV